MSVTRAAWMVVPSLGLSLAFGCGGPVPEPPAARAPMPAASLAPLHSGGEVQSRPIATEPAGSKECARGSATVGQPSVVRAKSPAAIAGDAAAKPARVRLAQVRPIALPDGPDFPTPASATTVTPRHVVLTAASSVSDSMPATHRIPPVPDETSPKSGPGTIISLAPSGDVRPASVPIIESQRIDRGLAERTPEFSAICQQADALNRHGFELAQRGAIYSARQEYKLSLQTIADALDAQRGSGAHRRMLAAGFKALDEADDFAADDNGSGAEINVANIARSHQTPVLKKDVKAGCSAQAAMGRYLTYAQEQLAGAVGDVPQGSAALFGLGKIYSVPLAAHGPKDSSGGAKSVAFYQASLMVDGRNFMAANELGVMLVRFGRFPEARAAFLHSLAISSQPIVWQNLAAVHQNLGEIELAERARRSAIAAANQTGSGAALAAYDVQWVDPATFARAKPIDADPINRVASSKEAASGK